MSVKTKKYAVVIYYAHHYVKKQTFLGLVSSIFAPSNLKIPQKLRVALRKRLAVVVCAQLA